MGKYVHLIKVLFISEYTWLLLYETGKKGSFPFTSVHMEIKLVVMSFTVVHRVCDRVYMYLEAVSFTYMEKVLYFCLTDKPSES